ncbi:hypothetical protein O1L55_39550 [Streptomyces albulus]|nr:hypothetical protein [Streptomyces noursei]
MLVARGVDDRQLWRLAVSGRSGCWCSPAASWLVDRIADAVEGVGPAAVTVGLIGGSGGAGGASPAPWPLTAYAGHRTVLVDADPWAADSTYCWAARRKNAMTPSPVARTGGGDAPWRSAAAAAPAY